MMNTKLIFQFFFSFSDVTVKYIRGLPHVTVPLPSRNEKCQFALRPVSHNVGDFLHMLRAEDKGIDRAAVLNRDGIRIAAACSIENLMDEDFWWDYLLTILAALNHLSNISGWWNLIYSRPHSVRCDAGNFHSKQNAVFVRIYLFIFC